MDILELLRLSGGEDVLLPPHNRGEFDQMPDIGEPAPPLGYDEDETILSPWDFSTLPWGQEGIIRGIYPEDA